MNRTCACGADLSDRHSSTKKCPDCRMKDAREYARKRTGAIKIYKNGQSKHVTGRA